MCGRFTVNYTYKQMLEFLEKEYSIFDFNIEFELPRFNMAPGQQVLSVINDGYNYRVGTFKWGFKSKQSMSKNNSLQIINTRSESIHEKEMFKDSFYNKRCIILADGFYEWDKYGTTNNPYYFTFENKELVAFAGIWNKYEKNGTPIYTTSIVTTKANDLVGNIHDRMPVVLSRIEAEKWLDCNNKDLEDLSTLFTSYNSNKMKSLEVSKYVNKVSNDNEKCIEENKELRLF